MTEVGTHAGSAPIETAKLEFTLGTQAAPKSNDDGIQEDPADVHEENKYSHTIEVNFPTGRAGAQLQMHFRTTGGEHVVTKVVEGGIADQQGVRVGDRLVQFAGKDLKGMSEKAVLQTIKAVGCTGTLLNSVGGKRMVEWIRCKERLQAMVIKTSRTKKQRNEHRGRLIRSS